MKKPGYVLLLTVMLLGVMVAVVTRLFFRGSLQVSFDFAMIEREKAKQIALGGVQVAMSQLESLNVEESKEQKEQAAKEPTKDPAIEQIRNIVPLINQWQEIKLTQPNEGIDAILRICIASENGKFDINRMFNFKTHKFLNEGAAGGKGDAKKLLQTVFGLLKPFTNGKELFELFEKFLKQRQYKLNDVSELLEIPEFAKAFGQNVIADYEISLLKPDKRPLSLSDLFTVWAEQPGMQPWLLSDSVLGMFGMNRSTNDIDKRKKIVDEITKDFKQGIQITQLWDGWLQKIYGKDSKSVSKEILEVLNPKFEPMVFSVLCYGTVGTITQKLCAIIEKRKPTEQNPIPFAVKRLYWF